MIHNFANWKFADGSRFADWEWPKFWKLQIYGWHPEPYKNSSDLPDHAPAQLKKYVQVTIPVKD